jgi:predicted DNA-binding transcriptional regulator YafY
MAKRPDNLETVKLALELLRRIPRNHKVTAAELKAQLADVGIERDVRTIQRQLELLSAEFEIERDERSKPYGYKWKENARGFALPMLTEQDSLLLALAQQHVGKLLPASLARSMQGLFSQAQSKLADGEKTRPEKEWLSKVRVVSTTQPLLPPAIKAQVFDEVTSALFANRWLQVSYQNSAGRKTQADVMPLGLAQQGPRMYLVCRFRGFEDERSLALHRIASAKASTLGFGRPKDFDLAKFDDDGRFGFGDGKKIRLTFCLEKATALHLTETPLSEDQVVKDLGDVLEFSATVVDTQQLDWWLRGFGDLVSRVRKRAVKGAGR